MNTDPRNAYRTYIRLTERLLERRSIMQLFAPIRQLDEQEFAEQRIAQAMRAIVSSPQTRVARRPNT